MRICQVRDLKEECTSKWQKQTSKEKASEHCLGSDRGSSQDGRRDAAQTKRNFQALEGHTMMVPTILHVLIRTLYLSHKYDQ